MNILHGISVIVLCTSLFYGVQGQATCTLSWENGTALSDTIWSFGLTLDAIVDTTPSGTIILSLTASSITSITTITPDSDSGYDFIQPVLDSENFTLTLSDYFTQYEELETQTTIRTTIIFQCSTNTRTLEIALPVTDTNNHYPEFQNAPYAYELPMPFPSGFSVQLFGEISARDIDLTNTNISFTLNSSDPNAAGFTASWLSQDSTDTKLHYAQLLTTTLLSFDNNITFKIYATDNGSPTLTSETDITISVDEANSVPASPIFTNAVYIADHSGLAIDEASGTLVSFNQGNISLSQGADSTVVYTITDNIGSYADNFIVSVSEDFSYISVTFQSVTEELLAEPYALLTLTATRAQAADTGVTILHIDLPGSVCVNSTVDTTTTDSSATECPTITTDACVCDTTTVTSSTVEDTSTTSTDNGNQDTTTAVTITTTETTECPIVTVTQECDCGSTTVTEAGTTLSLATETTTTVTPSLSFSSSVYRFDKDSSFTGVLMTQTAVATNAAGTIVYSVVIDDEDLASRVIIDADTAQLEVIAAISPAVHTFQIRAAIEDLSLSASASVVLVVSTLTNCSGEVVFGYALQVIELEEESAHENVLPLDDNGCNYTIYSQTPSQDLFSINGTSLNSVAIDREASYFSDMTVAQVRVIIDASCPNDTETVSTISKRDTIYEVLTENIPYERTRTILIVIITDINDNAPVWSSDTPSYIGFPGYELSQVLQVPYVYKFSATDADIGTNANVTYTLPTGSDDIFYIHNTEGSLYIQMGAYVEDGLELTIIASDGLFETSASLTVRKLESTNVMVLFVTSGVLEDVDDIVDQLSTSTGYWIGSLGSAVVSASDISTSKSVRSVSRRATRSSDVNTLLRVVLYGLVETEPVTSKVLVSTFDEANVTWVISESATLESILSEVTESDGTASSVDTRGYWAAIIVLSLLLILLLIAAGVVYYLFCRPRHSTSIESDITYENFEKSNVKEDNGPQFVNSITLGESRDDVTESTDWPSADWSANQTNNPDIFSFNNSRTFNPVTGGEGDLVFIKRNENVGKTSPNLTKRKSVAFNTTVEEIEVARL